MKPWVETAYLTSKSLAMLLVIPAGALFWFGWVAILAGTPHQKLLGASIAAAGAIVYALVVQWFGSLAGNGPETAYRPGNFQAADTYQERRYRR